MKNEWIREMAKSKGILLWQIADKLGITDGNFSRRLRHEMTQDEQERIRVIIDELAGGTGMMPARPGTCHLAAQG